MVRFPFDQIDRFDKRKFKMEGFSKFFLEKETFDRKNLVNSNSLQSSLSKF